MEVLAGNHTLQAARELGMAEVTVTQLDVDEEQARRIMLVDNRTISRCPPGPATATAAPYRRS